MHPLGLRRGLIHAVAILALLFGAAESAAALDENETVGFQANHLFEPGAFGENVGFPTLLYGRGPVEGYHRHHDCESVEPLLASHAGGKLTDSRAAAPSGIRDKFKSSLSQPGGRETL